MRNRFLRLLVIALTLAGCRAATPTPAPTATPPAASVISTPFDAPWSDRSFFAAGLRPSQQDALEGLPGATVYHLDLRISSDLMTVDGTERILYTNTETAPLEEIGLHLYPNLLGGEMTLTSARVDDTDVEPEYGEGDGSVRLPLTPALAPDASVELSLNFSVRVPLDLELNYGVLASTNGVLAYAHGYPMVAVYDSDGWNLDMPAPYGDITYSDASFYLVRVRAPADLVLCGSGIEVARSEANGQQDVTLAIGPARDFYLAGSREYRVTERLSDGTMLRVCSRDARQDRAERVLDVAALSLNMFGQWYADYPYTKLDIVTIPTLAGGIEYPAAFALNELYFTPEEDFPDRTEDIYLESVTVHEAAHEWFYNLVGNDQLEDPWLDEAMAQYATLRYYGEQYGEAGASGMRDSLYGRWDRVEREPIPIGMPVAAYDEGAYSPIVYGRGPLFIEALEGQMGRPTFDAFLKAYTAAYSWEEAAPGDFQQMAEAECDCDLDELFNEWVYGVP